MKYNYYMDQTDAKAKVKDFFSQFELRNYKKGELLLHPDEATGAFFLKEGHVREYSISPQGIEVGLHIFFPETYFPMTWIIADIPNRYYYEALTDILVFNAPKDKILKFLNENPDSLFELTKRILNGLDKLTSRIEFLSYGKASQKVASVLLYLVRHFGEERNKKIYINYKFTHKDIGSLAGLTRETTSRELEKLEDRGIIKTTPQTMFIIDLEKLKQELN